MITGLNHFNIVTKDREQMEKTACFYEQLGLTRGNRPEFGNTGIWLFYEDKPIVHLNIEEEVGEVVKGIGTVHHLGFNVIGSEANVYSRLTELGIEFKVWPTLVEGWYRALYFFDPNGVQIEFVLKDCYIGFKGRDQQVAA